MYFVDDEAHERAVNTCRNCGGRFSVTHVTNAVGQFTGSVAVMCDPDLREEFTALVTDFFNKHEPDPPTDVIPVGNN